MWSSTYAYSGKFGTKLTTTYVSCNDIYTRKSDALIPIAIDEKYHLSFYIKALTIADQVTVYVIQYNSSGTEVGTPLAVYQATPGYSWEHAQVSFGADTSFTFNAATKLIQLNISMTGGSQDAAVDDFRLIRRITGVDIILGTAPDDINLLGETAEITLGTSLTLDGTGKGSITLGAAGVLRTSTGTSRIELSTDDMFIYDGSGYYSKITRGTWTGNWALRIQGSTLTTFNYLQNYDFGDNGVTIRRRYNTAVHATRERNFRVGWMRGDANDALVLLSYDDNYLSDGSDRVNYWLATHKGAMQWSWNGSTWDTTLEHTASGVLKISNYLFVNNGIGIGVAPSSSYGLYFFEGTTVSNGIQFGTDTNLYRSAANTLKTDDKLVVGGSISSYGSGLSVQSNGSGTNLWDNATASFADNTDMAAGVGGGIIFEGEYITASTTLTPFGGVFGVKDNATSSNTTGNLIVWARNGRISFGTASSPTRSSYGEIVNINGTGIGIGTATITGKLNFVTGTTEADGIYFGTDVLMYRSAANTLTITGGPTTLVIGSATAGVGKIKLFGSDIYTGTIQTSDPTSNVTWTFSNNSGTIITTGNLSSITTTGTISSGTWQGGIISSTYGGTGVNNAGRTLTIGTANKTITGAGTTLTMGGNITTSGAYALTMTLSNTTSVTMPTTGTLISTGVKNQLITMSTATANGEYVLGVTNSGAPAATSAFVYSLKVEGTGSVVNPTTGTNRFSAAAYFVGPPSASTGLGTSRTYAFYAQGGSASTSAYAVSYGLYAKQGTAGSGGTTYAAVFEGDVIFGGAGTGFALYTATAGFGFGVGAGSTGTQATNKSTAVAMGKACRTGTITMNSAQLNAATIVSFNVTSLACAAGDIMICTHHSTGTFGAYTIAGRCTGTNTATISVRNNTAGNLSEAIVINFVILSAVTS